jgi:hypothetical protein
MVFSGNYMKQPTIFSFLNTTLSTSSYSCISICLGISTLVGLLRRFGAECLRDPDNRAVHNRFNGCRGVELGCLCGLIESKLLSLAAISRRRFLLGVSGGDSEDAGGAVAGGTAPLIIWRC